MSRAKAKPEQGTTSFARFAGIYGCAASYITQLKDEGRLVLTDDGKRVCTRESLARIAASADPAKTAVAARHAANREARAGDAKPNPPSAPPAPADAPDADDEPVDGPIRPDSYQDWRRRSEKAKALGLERDNALADGKLLDAEAVAGAIAAATTTLRTRLESLPPILGPQLAAETDEHRATALVAESIERALDEIAREFGALAKVSA